MCGEVATFSSFPSINRGYFVLQLNDNSVYIYIYLIFHLYVENSHGADLSFWWHREQQLEIDLSPSRLLRIISCRLQPQFLLPYVIHIHSVLLYFWCFLMFFNMKMVPCMKEKKEVGGAESAAQKAEDVVTSMLAKGFILGKDALSKAKELDERHQFTSTATAKVASLDKRIGLSEKISVGTSVVNDKFKEMDEKYQVSEKTKSAFTAAEQTVSSAGSAIIKNRYVFTGATWVTGAFNRVAKAAEEVGSKAKEKVAEEEGSKKEEKAAGKVESKTEEKEAGEVESKTKEEVAGAEEEKVKGVVEDVAHVQLTDSPKQSPKAAADGERSPKPPPAEGFIL